MLRASWKSLLGRKLRLFMSAFAIILGVSFVSGSFIFTDTLSRAFDGIVNTVGEVVVRPDTASSDFDSGPTSKTVPGSLVADPVAAARRGPRRRQRHRPDHLRRVQEGQADRRRWPTRARPLLERRPDRRR